MAIITSEQLKALFEAGIIRGPEFLETKQSYLADGGEYIEDLIDALEGVSSVAVANDANVATVVSALKTLGLFTDPP
jgi:hypothetical protein